MTPYAALLERARHDPARPLVTSIDAASGAVMELSATSLLNAIAKTAGLLRDDLDLEPGDDVGIRLPLHWQRAVWWGACAFVGGVYAPHSTAAITVTDRASLDECDGADDLILVSLAPFGLPDGEPVPAGVTDAAVATRAHPDHFTPYDVPRDDWPLMPGLTATEVMTQARALAERRGLTRGERFAVLANDPAQHLLQLAVPLALDGSVVLIDGDSANGDRDWSGTLAEQGARLTREDS